MFVFRFRLTMMVCVGLVSVLGLYTSTTADDDGTFRQIACIGNGVVTAVAWNPDGSQFVTVGTSGILLFDKHGNRFGTVLDSYDAATSVSWSSNPDHLWLATSSPMSRFINIVDLQSGEIVAMFEATGTRYPEYALPHAWTADGTQLIVARDTTLEFIDIMTQTTTRSLDLNAEAEISHIASSSDGNHVAVRHDDGSNGNITIWSLDTQTIVRTFTAVAIASIQWSPDGKNLLMQQNLRTQIYNVLSDDIIATLPPAMALWKADDRVLLFFTNRIEEWDLTSSILETTYATGGVFYETTTRVSPMGSGVLDIVLGGFQYYDFATEAVSFQRNNFQALGAPQWSPDGKTFAAKGSAGTLYVYRVDNREVVASLYLTDLTAFAWASDTSIFIGTRTGSILAWDTSTQAAHIINEHAHISDIFEISFSDDGTLYATRSTIDAKVWQQGTNMLLLDQQSGADTRILNGLHWNTANQLTIRSSTGISIWDFQTMPFSDQPIATLDNGWIFNYAWSPGNDLLAVRSRDLLTVYNMGGEIRHTREYHDSVDNIIWLDATRIALQSAKGGYIWELSANTITCFHGALGNGERDFIDIDWSANRNQFLWSNGTFVYLWGQVAN